MGGGGGGREGGMVGAGGLVYRCADAAVTGDVYFDRELCTVY